MDNDMFGPYHKAKVDACSPMTLRALALALGLLLGESAPLIRDLTAHADKWEQERSSKALADQPGFVFPLKEA